MNLFKRIIRWWRGRWGTRFREGDMVHIFATMESNGTLYSIHDNRVKEGMFCYFSLTDNSKTYEYADLVASGMILNAKQKEIPFWDVIVYEVLLTLTNSSMLRVYVDKRAIVKV